MWVNDLRVREALVLQQAVADGDARLCGVRHLPPYAPAHEV